MHVQRYTTSHLSDLAESPCGAGVDLDNDPPLVSEAKLVHKRVVIPVAGQSSP